MFVDAACASTAATKGAQAAADTTTCIIITSAPDAIVVRIAQMDLPVEALALALSAIAVRDTLVPLTARRTIWSAAVDVGLTSVSSAVAAGRQMRSGRRR